jgi:hypothetical protein
MPSLARSSGDRWNGENMRANSLSRLLASGRRD